MEAGKELLLQDGHAKEVYGVGFHPDGSLVATADFVGVVQYWDLRTGKSACHFLVGSLCSYLFCADIKFHIRSHTTYLLPGHAK